MRLKKGDGRKTREDKGRETGIHQVRSQKIKKNKKGIEKSRSRKERILAFNWKRIHRLSYSLCCIWYICIGISLFCIRMQGMYIYTLDVQTATCRLSLDTQLLDTRLDQTTRRSIDPSPAFDPAASMDRPRLSLFCLDQQFRIQLRQNESSSQTDIHPVLVLNFWLCSGSILARFWLRA